MVAQTDHAAQHAGEPVNVWETYWGVWGPKAITWAINKSKEVRFVLPEHVFYPLNFTGRRALASLAVDLSRFIKEGTVSIHFYDRRLRSILANKFGGTAQTDSLEGKLFAKHEIYPQEAPIIRHGA